MIEKIWKRVIWFKKKNKTQNETNSFIHSFSWLSITERLQLPSPVLGTISGQKQSLQGSYCLAGVTKMELLQCDPWSPMIQLTLGCQEGHPKEKLWKVHRNSLERM